MLRLLSVHAPAFVATTSPSPRAAGRGARTERRAVFAHSRRRGPRRSAPRAPSWARRCSSPARSICSRTSLCGSAARSMTRSPTAVSVFLSRVRRYRAVLSGSRSGSGYLLGKLLPIDTSSAASRFLRLRTWFVRPERRDLLRRRLLARVRVLGLQGRAPPDRGSVAHGDGVAPRSRPAVPRRAHLHAVPPARVPRGRPRARARDQGDRGARRCEQHCPVCRADGRASFLVCPVCTTQAASRRAALQRPLEPLWQVCPYCETPIERRRG